MRALPARFTLLAVTGLAAMMAVTACTSTADSPSATSMVNPLDPSYEAPTPELQQAAARLRQYAQPNEALLNTEPLPALPTGKKIAYLVTALPLTQAYADAVREAAPFLGLDVTYIDAGQSASSATQAMDQAIAINPDLIIYSGFDISVFDQQLPQYRRNGGLVLGFGMGGKSSTPEGMDFQLETGDDFYKMGTLVADYAAVKTGGTVDALGLYLPTYPTTRFTVEGAQNQLAEVCPDSCTMDLLESKPSEIGTVLPGVVANRLQRDRDVNYIIPAFDTVYTGIPEQLNQSGLRNQILGAGTTVAGQVIFNAIQSGNADMVVARPTGQCGWQLADTAARMLLGVEVPTSDKSPTGFNQPVQVIDKSTLTFDPNKEWIPWDGYKDAYKEVWGVS